MGTDHDLGVRKGKEIRRVLKWRKNMWVVSRARCVNVSFVMRMISLLNVADVNNGNV